MLRKNELNGQLACILISMYRNSFVSNSIKKYNRLVPTKSPSAFETEFHDSAVHK